MKDIYRISKKYYLVSICIFFIWSIIASSCCERRIPDEKDLVKYPELTPFVCARTYFRGICFDMDTGVYEFVIKTNHNSQEQYF